MKCTDRPPHIFASICKSQSSLDLLCAARLGDTGLSFLILMIVFFTVRRVVSPKLLTPTLGLFALCPDTVDASVLLAALEIYEEKEVTSEPSRDPRAAGLPSSADEQMALLVTVNTV